MNWKERYRAALVATSPIELFSLIHDAEVAISERSECLPAVTTQELQEMSDANYTLRFLKSTLPAGRT